MNNGIPYFPLDVHLDDKFELIEAEFGLTGFAVVVKLFQKIYGDNGYYCEWTYDVALLFARKIGLGVNAVSEILRASIKRGIFDSRLYEEYHILTSKGIQNRYLEAVSRRKKVEIQKAYLLVKVAQKYENVYILDENVYISDKNAYIFEQSKEEESKVKKSRGKQSNKDDSAAPAIQTYISVFGTEPSANIKSKIKVWLKKVSVDVIVYAINEADANNARKWAYVEKILNSHYSAGRTTLDAILLNKRTYNHNTANLGVFQPAADVDYDELEKIMREKYKDD